MIDFSKLEADLKELRPLPPSAELSARVEHSLGNAATTATAGVLPRKPKTRLNWLTFGLSLAAAAAVFLLARPNVEESSPKPPAITAQQSLANQVAPTRAFVPDGLTRVVYDRSDQGLVFPRNSTAPLRRVRSLSQETLKWKDAGSGASLRVSYPTEEIEFIPVPVQ